MKPALTLLATLIVLFSVQAQSVSLKKRDSTSVNTVISAISNTTLYTPAGSFLFSQLSSAAFELKQQKDQTTYDRLEAAGVEVIFTGSPIVPDDSSVKPNQKQIAPDVEQLRASLRRYQNAHKTGTGLQLLGMGLTIAGSALYMSDPEGNKDIAQILTVGGGLSFLIGLGVELSVGGVKF